MPASDSTEASISFYNSRFLLNDNTDHNTWRIGSNSWNNIAGVDNFNIGCFKHKKVLSIDNQTGNVDIATTATLNNGGVLSTTYKVNNGGTPQWLYIGNYISSVAGGAGNPDKANLKIEFISHSYYNDVDVIDNQDSMIIFRFKTGSTTTSPFKGNGTAYRIGKAMNPSIIRIIQEGTDGFVEGQNTDRYHFYAYYGHFSDGSLITITSTIKFNYFGQLSVIDPFVVNGRTVEYAQIPIKTIFNQDNPPAISDIPQLVDNFDNIFCFLNQK